MQLLLMNTVYQALQALFNESFNFTNHWKEEKIYYAKNKSMLLWDLVLKFLKFKNSLYQQLYLTQIFSNDTCNM